MSDTPPPLEPSEIEVAHKMLARGNPWTTALGIAGLTNGGLARGRNIIAALRRHNLFERKEDESQPRVRFESRPVLYRIREDVVLPPMPGPRVKGPKDQAVERDNTILQALRTLPPWRSTADIVEATGICETSAGIVLRRLLEQGIVERVLGESPAKRRKPWLYRIRPVETKDEQQ